MLPFVPQDFLRCLKDAVGGFILQMVYDHKILKDDLFMGFMLANVVFAVESLSKHYWVNDLPFLRYVPVWFPGTGFKRKALGIPDMRVQYATQTFKSVMHKVRTDSINHPSYVSRLLELKGGTNVSDEDLKLIKWSAAAMFGTGSSTTVGVITTFTLMMASNPGVAKKAQEEIDQVIGRDRISTLVDRDSLPYFDAALQESLRIAPPVPLGLSHCTTEDIKVRDYVIPKGATIEGNIWAILYDPEHYPTPYTFDPSRFLGPSPAPDARKYIFGFGRWICPGLHVANNATWIMCAGLVSLFNIRSTLELRTRANGIGEETWKLFKPFDPM